MMQTLLAKFEVQEKTMNSLAQRVASLENRNNGAVARDSNL